MAPKVSCVWHHWDKLHQLVSLSHGQGFCYYHANDIQGVAKWVCLDITVSSHL